MVLIASIFFVKKTSALEIHRLMIDVIADRHQEILGIYRKWRNKRPGRLFNVKSPSGGVQSIGSMRLKERGVYSHNCNKLNES